MASNIPITTGSGSASVATEQIGANQYQIIKIVGGETGSTSVLGVTPDGALKVSVLGTVTTTPSGAGSVITVLQSSSIIAVVTGSVVAIPNGNQSVSGTVDIGDIKQSVFGASIIGVAPVTQSGEWRTSVISATPSSLLTGASIFGQLPAGTAPLGSVATLQGTNPWVVTNVGSIIAVQQGSIITVPSGTQNVSGSVVAFVNGTVPITVVGSVLAYQSPLASIIQGSADLRVVQGASVAVLAAPGATIRNYVKHVQISNFGSASVLVTIADNTTSILGYSIAPAGGGSNYDCDYRAAVNSPVTASINGTASVLVSMQGFTA